MVDVRWYTRCGAGVVLRADDDVMQPNGVIVRTGADGRYSADVSKHDWGTSKIRCRALAPGFAYATASLEASVGRATVDFTLKAESWKTTEVRLADPAGRPGVGVAVSCLVDDLPWQTLKTDGAGRCLVNMAIGQAIWLEARPAASRPIRAIIVNMKGSPAKVVLPILGPITGRIHDNAGRPLGGITVGRLIDVGEKGMKVHPHFFSETVTTGSDGRFAYTPMVILKNRDLGGGQVGNPYLGRSALPIRAARTSRSGWSTWAGRSSRWISPSSGLDSCISPSRSIRCAPVGGCERLSDRVSAAAPRHAGVSCSGAFETTDCSESDRIWARCGWPACGRVRGHCGLLHQR